MAPFNGATQQLRVRAANEFYDHLDGPPPARAVRQWHDSHAPARYARQCLVSHLGHAGRAMTNTGEYFL